MGVRSLLALALAAAAGCVTAPDVPDPGDGKRPEQVFADVLLNYHANGEFGTCRKELPPCEEPLETPCDNPADMPPQLAVLGEPDGAALTFDFDGRFDVGIHCGAITEAGPLIIHASGLPGTQSKVFASLDGIYFTQIGTFDVSMVDAGIDVVSFQASFSLTTYGLHSIRYIRVFDTGGGGMSVDAIEGTWSGDPGQ